MLLLGAASRRARASARGEGTGRLSDRAPCARACERELLTRVSGQTRLSGDARTLCWFARARLRDEDQRLGYDKRPDSARPLAPAAPCALRAGPTARARATRYRAPVQRTYPL